MSTTNRAFIKAYRQDTARPGTTGNEPVIAREQAANARVPSTAPMTNAPRFISPVAGAAPRPAAERRPLSSYISRPQTTEVTSPGDVAAANALRPGTTVATFNWPAVCRTLLQQSGPQLDHIIRLLFTRANAGNSLIGVLGLFNRIGTTTTALCLASRAAGRGQRVVLADGNFRNPRMATTLDAVPTAGWEEVLRNGAPLTDAVIHATGENLDLLALGARPIKDPQPLVGGLQAAVTAGILRHAYELAIVDLGTFFDPVGQPTLLELVSNMGIDAVVAIAGPEPADRRDIITIAEHLDRSSCEFLGVIENRITKPRAA